MNPYLRVIQPIRPSTFFFAKEILEGTWPEMEPESSTRPSPHAELLEEEPIDPEPKSISERTRASSDILMATATIGLFFGDELIAKAVAPKWLMADNHFFRYGTYKEAVILFPSPDEPRTRVHYRNPGDWWWEGVQSSESFWWKEAPTAEAIDMWNAIEEEIVDEINAWEPPPPTNMESATPAIIGALSRTTQSQSFKVLDPRLYSGVGIVYAIWSAPFPGREAPFPIFAIRRERKHPQPPAAAFGVDPSAAHTPWRLYFNADEVVIAAVAALETEAGITFPENYDPQSTINRLESEVQSVLHGD